MCVLPLKTTTMRNILSIILITLSLQSFSITSWIEGVGGGVAYNFQHQGVGANARVKLNVFDPVIIVPQFTYFSFASFYKKINEFYIGANAQMDIYHYRALEFYATVGAHYNKWNNANSFDNKYAQINNIAIEGGGGIKTYFNCWEPFLEMKYNIKWQEVTSILGVNYNFNCKKNGTGKPNSIIPCPSFAKF